MWQTSPVYLPEKGFEVEDIVSAGEEEDKKTHQGKRQ